MTYPFLNRCHGYFILESPPLTPNSRAALLAALPAARERFKRLLTGGALGHEDCVLGGRFHHDPTVLGRVRSAASELGTTPHGFPTEAEILAEPDAWALDALHACALADYHYTYNRDHGK